jgi:crotonobetainyl-CoA:carnitine CoA-transferase CaiB-like acyl-CoA transferase
MAMTLDAAAPRRALEGMRIVEIGHFVAAPFATRILADLGADIIKVEAPAGDPVAIRSGGQFTGATNAASV